MTTLKQHSARYSTLSISMHWLMLVLIAAVYACIELKGNFPKGSDPRELLKQWHFMLGLTVFALVWVRLLARLISPTPPVTPELPDWQAVPAKLMHVALYALMIGLPLVGWIVLSAAGKPIPFFGLELPALIGKNPDLASNLKEWHELGGVLGYWLIGLHALAAVIHHHVRHDDTLTRMLPGK